MITAKFTWFLALQLQGVPPPPPPPPAPIVLSGPAEPIVQNGNGVIDGKVIRQDTGEPVRDAQITIAILITGITTTQRQLTALTDSIGAFSFKDLPDGAYTVRVQRENFFDSSNSSISALPAA